MAWLRMQVVPVEARPAKGWSEEELEVIRHLPMLSDQRLCSWAILDFGWRLLVDSKDDVDADEKDGRCSFIAIRNCAPIFSRADASLTICHVCFLVSYLTKPPPVLLFDS